MNIGKTRSARPMTKGMPIGSSSALPAPKVEAEMADCAEMAGWLAEGRLKTFEDIAGGGIAAFPETFLRLFRGQNTGKLMLQVASG